MTKSRKNQKSLIAEYKAKARGKKTSKMKASDKRGSKKAPQEAHPVRVPVTEMTVGDRTYSKGDIAWYILESTWTSKKPATGEILECHPNDKIEPSISVWDDTTRCYRTIRASLVGWNKEEAKKNWELFIKSKERLTS